jgi:hypothetical protein
MPVLSHVATPLRPTPPSRVLRVEHWVVPGVHVPVHVPPEHADVVHVVPSTHEPVASHVWMTCPLHRVVFGLQVPEHEPPLQTSAQVVPSTQLPVGSHVWGVKLLHWRVSGVHTPVQAPPVHRYGHVSTRVVLTRSTPHCSTSEP